MKTCSKCKIDKDESEFRKRKTTTDRLHSYCKTCEKERLYEWRKNNPERVKANSVRTRAKWVKTNPEKYRCATKKATKKTIENLNPSYLKCQLRAKGYSDDVISLSPAIIDVQKIKIIIHRFNKMQNEGKFSNPNSKSTL